MYSNDISIRSVQHYLYCPHRWGLIEIDKVWAENYFVTKANIMHERVHNPDYSYKKNNCKVYTSVAVYNDETDYNLYGITDCIEVYETSNASGNSEDKNIIIVEYKPRKPKEKDYNFDDLMQIFAQKKCVDYIFSCNCKAEVYYADVKRRYRLPLQENYSKYDIELKKILGEMRLLLESGVTPPIIKGQKCNGCSMKDLCMPKAKRKFDVRKEIKKIILDGE